jgi:predicted transcriptional regulator
MDKFPRRDNLYGMEYREEDRRRVPSEDRKTFNIKQLWQRSHEIVNLSARGFKNVEIAEMLGVTPACVSQTLNSTLGKEKLAEVRLSRDEEAKAISRKIQNLTNKALATYDAIFDDDSGECGLMQKAKVADTVVLELSGLRAPTRIQSTNASVQLTSEELKAFQQRGLDAIKEAGMTIDIQEDAQEGELIDAE